MRTLMMKDSYEKRLERIERVMRDFRPTPAVIESIIAMNDGLYERFRMAFEDLLRLKRLVDVEISYGRLPVSGYEMFPEYFFAYDRSGGIPTADYVMLQELSDETQNLMPSLTFHESSLERDLDFETAFLDNDLFLNWNIESFGLPGLENHQIHYFMHQMFQDANTFCPADIPYLKPEDLKWQITVQYEFFNK